MLQPNWEVIEKPQRKALESLREFTRYGVLGGGTALALQLGHRKSVDLDFFLPKQPSLQLVAKIQRFYQNIETIVRTGDEFSFISPYQVKITFLFYPYKPLYKTIETPDVSLFSWKDIALDKAYTIGRRQEWRDYVDVYYCIQKGFSLQKLIQESEKKFGDSFSSKLFLSQLIYLDDLAESESVEFIGEAVTPKKVRLFFEREVKNLKLV